MMNKPTRQLAVALGIVEYDDRFLIARRIDPDESQWHEKWEFPGGKVRASESAEAAAIREVLEETGLTMQSVRFLGQHVHDWECPEFIQHTLLNIFWGRAPTTMVRLLPDAHSAHRWVTVEEFLAIPITDHLVPNPLIIQHFYVPARTGR